jgi:hypothetical protein
LRLGQPPVIQASSRQDDEHHGHNPEADHVGKRAGDCTSGEDRSKSATECVDGRMHQYRQKHAGPRVVENPRYDYGERDGGNGEERYAQDAATAGGRGPGWDQELRQVPQRSQHTEDE